MAKKLGGREQVKVPPDISRILRRYPDEAHALLRHSFGKLTQGGFAVAESISSYGKRKFRVIDLFAGAGGFTLGMCQTERFQPVFANDFNAYAAKTYNANFGDHCLHGDINDILANGSFKFPEAEIVIGGPPCQGFSPLNKQREGDPRKQLWMAFMEVVRRINPVAFVMENVPELLSSAEFESIREHAEAMGYFVTSGVLNAADYGVPQRRKRAIVLASRLGLLSLPTPTHCNPQKNPTLFQNGMLPWETVKRAIYDLPVPEGIELRAGDILPPLDLHFGRTPTKQSLARYRCVPEGGNRFDLQKRRPDLTPECWIRKKSGGTDLFGRLWENRPAFTIRTEFFKPEKGRYLHPIQHRPITHREAARLQSFPDSFKFTGTKIEIAKQIGNAVPPLLGKRIAEVLIDHL
ncbi:MAG: DNA cytosine methyltransferase [Nitrospira sp.]|jgi:DNA (cytosine-5)-methyltransferase 1|nr:DNA cytosine methyltransferase [Nitrospira sp.]MDI3466338.1 DNA-cytosine methyltransferase [Nitrospira sp.]